MKNKLMKKISFRFCLAFMFCLLVSGSFSAAVHAKTQPLPVLILIRTQALSKTPAVKAAKHLVSPWFPMW